MRLLEVFSFLPFPCKNYTLMFYLFNASSSKLYFYMARRAQTIDFNILLTFYVDMFCFSETYGLELLNDSQTDGQQSDPRK